MGLKTDSIALSIGFKNRNDMNLYENIRDILEKQCNISIKYIGDAKLKRKLEIKENKKGSLEELNRINYRIKEKYDELKYQLERILDDLALYAYNVSDPNIGEPRYELIPDDWYDWEEYDGDLGEVWIQVCCHKETNMYKFLDEHGLLRRSRPWLEEMNLI